MVHHTQTVKQNCVLTTITTTAPPPLHPPKKKTQKKQPHTQHQHQTNKQARKKKRKKKEKEKKNATTKRLVPVRNSVKKHKHKTLHWECDYRICSNLFNAESWGKLIVADEIIKPT